jgi:hypothetical protein
VCYSGVTEVSQWGHNVLQGGGKEVIPSVTVVLQCCYSVITVMLQGGGKGVIPSVLLWFYSVVTVLLQCCYSVVTVVLQWCYQQLYVPATTNIKVVLQ